MLQILLETNDRYSLAELAQMAVEGGCSWLVLADCSDSAEKRDNYPAIVDLCREAGVMLTASADLEAVKEYGMHGIFLPLGSTAPASVRELLGAEAVIGAEIAAAGSALTLERADIDYVATGDLSILADIRAAACRIPVVAPCDADPQRAAALIAAGFSGVCCSGIYKYSDPVSAVSNLLDTISN